MKYKVIEEDTLLEFLYKNIKNSKNSIKNLLKNGMIFVNEKQIVKFDYKIYPNQIISIRNKIENKIDVLYEDKYIVVINKPHNLLTVGTEKEKENTAYHLISTYLKEKNKTAKVFIIHRLDKETSGTLVFAKDEKTKQLFQENWEELVKTRGYIATVEGHVTKKEGIIHTWLEENKNGFVYSNKNKQGKEAITEYKVIKEKENRTIIDIKLKTGRKNQIRVHMKELGNVIVGDKKYGSTIKSRLLLHCYILEFIHPITKKMISIKTKIPNEISS